MLDFRPDLVRMDKAKNFVSSAIAMEKEFKHLTADRHAFVRLDRARTSIRTARSATHRSRPPRRAGDRRASGRRLHCAVARYDDIRSVAAAIRGGSVSPCRRCCRRFTDIVVARRHVVLDRATRVCRCRFARGPAPVCGRRPRRRFGVARHADRERHDRAHRRRRAARRPRPDAVDLHGRQVWPMLVDVHTHLDRGHTVVRSPNVNGTFTDALAATQADRLRWTHEDLLARMSFGLRCAYAHGVSAIRTHLDSVPEQAERSWRAFARHARGVAGPRRAAGACRWCRSTSSAASAARSSPRWWRSPAASSAPSRARRPRRAHGAPLDDLDALLDRLFALRRAPRPRHRSACRRERRSAAPPPCPMWRAPRSATATRAASPAAIAAASRSSPKRRPTARSISSPRRRSRSSRCRPSTSISRTAAAAARRAGAASRWCTRCAAAASRWRPPATTAATASTPMATTTWSTRSARRCAFCTSIIRWPRRRRWSARRRPRSPGSPTTAGCTRARRRGSSCSTRARLNEMVSRPQADRIVIDGGRRSQRPRAGLFRAVGRCRRAGESEERRAC